MQEICMIQYKTATTKMTEWFNNKHIIKSASPQHTYISDHIKHVLALIFNLPSSLAYNSCLSFGGNSSGCIKGCI